MSGVGIIWRKSPADLAVEVEKYGRKIVAATQAAGTILAEEAERAAKANAPWNDRTGAARAGLTGLANIAETLVSIYLYHTVEYGIWLEIAMGMRYQIILPTLESLYPRVFQVIREQLG